MSLQALNSLAVSSFEHKPAKSKVRRSKDANRDLGGAPGVVRIDGEFLGTEEIKTQVYKYAYSIEWNSNPDARSYSHRYIVFNEQVNDIQLLKDIFNDFELILAGFKELNSYWINESEEKNNLIDAANQFADEFNSRIISIPATLIGSVDTIFEQFLQKNRIKSLIEFKIDTSELTSNHKILFEEEVINSFSALSKEILKAIGRKLKDLESDAGSILNYKVFNYEPELSIHDAVDADMSVDELKESIILYSKDALVAQANQDPGLAVGLLRSI
ncbi:MAG: hypothetical protein KDD56_05445 [Bdellovibrionales bacterium]|nr:hypothetical protein [Bdellovibrionales bacterium]